LELSNGDLGYFLGASDPSHIRTAIIAAYMERYPQSNAVVSPWENWDIYKFNKLFYGAAFFEKSGHQDVFELSKEMLNSYEMGGTVDRQAIPFARVCKQKKHRLVVSLAEFFEKKPPTGIPEPNFFTMADLDALHVQYANKVEERKLIKLSKKVVADAVEKSHESDSDEE